MKRTARIINNGRRLSRLEQDHNIRAPDTADQMQCYKNRSNNSHIDQYLIRQVPYARMLLYFLCMYNHHTPCLSFLADSRNHRKVFPVLLALRNLIVNFDIHTAEVFPNDFPYFRTRNVSFQTWKPLGHDNDRTSNVLVFSICFRIIYSYQSTNYASEHLTWKYTVLCSSLGDN